MRDRLGWLAGIGYGVLTANLRDHVGRSAPNRPARSEVPTEAVLRLVETDMDAYVIVSVAGGVLAAVPGPDLLAVESIDGVIIGLQDWVIGILAAVATLFLVIGGLRYVTAGGDPAQVEQAKGNFKSALVGYALAVLAPVVLEALQGILGA